VTARNVAIIGLGRMGRAIQDLAPRMGWNVCATFDAGTSAGGAGITPQALNGADAAVEFTEPAAAAVNVRACVRAGCPVVVGTTGWYDALPEIEREVESSRGALLWAPNFSLGVNVLDELVRSAGDLLGAAGGFEAHIVETHHAAKKDAPSGTAAMLRRTLAGSAQREPGVTSVRVGSVPGTHEVVFDAPFEQLVLRHEARDRRVFAAGALTAAAWLIGRQGVFTMRDVLKAGGG
jgi:4-hydroxy-tetrahydrodipicolinate reductase